MQLSAGWEGDCWVGAHGSHWRPVGEEGGGGHRCCAEYPQRADHPELETENDLRFAESPDHRDQSYQPAIIKDCRLIRLFAMIGLKIKKSLSKQSAVSCLSILYRT